MEEKHTTSERRFRPFVGRLFARQEVSLILVIVAIVVAATIKSPYFFTHENVLQIFEGSVTYFIVGTGSALLIIGGGLDFSVGAAFTLGGLVSAKAMTSGMPVSLAIAVGLASCIVVGVVNFASITYGHVPPIIATLGVFYILTGFTSQITGGNDVVPLPNSFQTIAQDQVAGIPNTIIFAIVIGIIGWIALDKTRFGVNVRALGGNRMAAIGNGLRVVKLDLTLYIVAALTAGFAGILYASSVGSGQVDAGGATATLNVITAVLIGGVSLAGGMGTIQGVALGSVLLSLINNALVLTNIPPTDSDIVIGAILVIAVAVDHHRRERLYRKR
jgi:ribose/xylose/arabinose/galactoside ABC-type transport system permease subunit